MRRAIESKESVYKEYHDKVVTYIAGKISNPQDIEDLVSCVFLKVYQGLGVFDNDKASLSTWIYAITRNTVIDYYRTKKSFSEFPENYTVNEEIDDKIIKDDILEHLYQSLLHLDGRSRDLIILHYYSGMTLKDIADKMQMSYANIKVIHKKALQKLRGLMDVNY